MYLRLDSISPWRVVYLMSILFYPLARPTSPCTPSPCGSNAICKEQNGVGSCACLPEYIGNPYEGCRPECTISSDCSSNLACIRNKCQNPCPGTCGQDAICQVINHSPTCTCIPGFTGDPFRYCQLMREPGKVFSQSGESTLFRQWYIQCNTNRLMVMFRELFFYFITKYRRLFNCITVPQKKEILSAFLFR